MIRAFGVAALLATFSGSLAVAAPAPQITVDIAGKPAQEVNTELADAASRVCRAASTQDLLDAFGDRYDCIHDTLRQAMVDLKATQNRDMLVAQNVAGLNAPE